MLYIRRSLEGLYWDIHIILFRLSSSSTLHTRPTLEAEFSNSLYTQVQSSAQFSYWFAVGFHTVRYLQNARIKGWNEHTHGTYIYIYIVWNFGLCNSISLGIWVYISLSCLSLSVFTLSPQQSHASITTTVLLHRCWALALFSRFRADMWEAKIEERLHKTLKNSGIVNSTKEIRRKITLSERKVRRRARGRADIPF